MNAAYFEMIGGASGNMLLGALLDAGADRGRLEAALRTVPVAGWKLECRRVVKRGIAATFFDFEIPGEDHTPPLAGFSHEHEHDHEQAHSRAERRLEDVLDILDRSGLSEWQKTRARTIYVRLAQAEARVHGKSVEHVVFHEVGQIDAILDVAGACVALDLLEVESVFCSPFPIGEGSIAMTHGAYPNPPPATAELLRGAPTFAAGVVGEMVTTTGAAILTALVQTPGTRPPMTAERIGYGAGRSDFAIPNVLRASIGPLFEAPAGADEIVVLEATIDDMQPQHFELALERVLAAGAFDAWLAPLTMKKSRPAILFGAIAPLEREGAVAQAILRETSTLGVRVRRERRYTLERHVETVATEFGPVRVKIIDPAGSARRTLEYDDVVRIARERRLPIAEVAARLQELLPPR